MLKYFEPGSSNLLTSNMPGAIVIMLQMRFRNANAVNFRGVVDIDNNLSRS